MADYDQSGNPIPPADAEAAREGSPAATGDSSDPNSPDYVSPDVVTVTAPPNSNWWGLVIVVGLLYFLMKDSAHENE